MQLVKAVYDITATFPADEKYGLAQQLRRAAVSVPSNIAEGAGRSSAGENRYHLSVARGSLAELDTQLKLAVMLGYISTNNIAFDLANRVGKLLTGLHRKWSKA